MLSRLRLSDDREVLHAWEAGPNGPLSTRGQPQLMHIRLPAQVSSFCYSRIFHHASERTCLSIFALTISPQHREAPLQVHVIVWELCTAEVNNTRDHHNSCRLFWGALQVLPTVAQFKFLACRSLNLMQAPTSNAGAVKV